MELEQAEQMFKKFGCSRFFMWHDGEQEKVKSYITGNFEKYEQKWRQEEIQRILTEMLAKKVRPQDFWQAHEKLIRLAADQLQEQEMALIVQATRHSLAQLSARDKFLLAENIVGRTQSKGCLDLCLTEAQAAAKADFCEIAAALLAEAKPSQYVDEERIVAARKRLAKKKLKKSEKKA